MLEKRFDAERLYNSVVHYYIDKKRYPKEKANRIAQTVVKRERQKRICDNPECGHFLHDHLRNTEACLVSDCGCGRFVSGKVDK